MRINLIYNFWDKIFLHENLQSGSLYLDQCSACITTLPIEQLFWKGKSTIVCLERQSWFYSIIHRITWTSIQIKRKALIVHASVSVLLLCCNPFWYTDVWTLLIHFPPQSQRKFVLPWFLKTFYQTRKAVSSRWKEGADASRGECVQFPTELLPGAWPCVQLPPRAGADPARLR